MATGVHSLAPEVGQTPIIVNGEIPAVNGGNGHSHPTPTTKSDFKVGEFAIDEDRPIRVAVIGAGYSGIIAGIRLPQRLKNVELVIYEKLGGVGGTWFANRYPGLACDIPAHSYQLTFEPNPHWSAFYAPGPEIRQYLEGVVEKYKLMRYIKLNHEMTTAKWNADTGKWNLTVIGPEGEFEDNVDFVMNCVGGLSRWDWPDIEGLENFKGKRVHSAQWDLQKEGDKEPWEGKNVAVIGVGSSAIQIVPAIHYKAAKVVNFVRGKTWIAAPFASSEIQIRNPGGDTHHFTEAEMREFEDPEYYADFRHRLEDELNAVHGATQRGHPIQAAAVQIFKEAMIKKLEKKPWIAEHLVPTFPVACRRLTPGPGYLEALCADNVDFVPKHIKRITETGIETVDGQHLDFDIIVCATGYDTTFRPRHPVIGTGGVNLQDKWKDHPVTYLTMAVDGFPNWFYSLGPNSAVGSGSLLVLMEREIEYIIKIIGKAQKERLKSIEVKKEAVDDFDEYLDTYFQQTVYSQKCRSWYKMGKEEGRVAGLWPGSTLHALLAFKNPRWEDFNYEPLETKKNRFYWLGNGWTVAERDGLVGERAWYLNEIDYPPVPK
ncbi:hypothetical protein M422DRAFT_207723 [Sphaerobolus stellatus SS14]|uniref:L-ornithine N(5)-oxygenase n=1 Tax=Sphaerobolus stellatus (strain SS14) TaxID=990650 RepID=A0A0C9VQV0_SPHS4|nr:hypothetical protein M422DRAFT_207723 [Sphaerobolus stellatus SS14]